MSKSSVMADVARRELEQVQREDSALLRLLRSLDAPTSFCFACAQGEVDDRHQSHLHHQNHMHHHDDRAGYALLLVEAAAPAIRRLLAANRDLKQRLALPGCSEECLHAKKES